MELILGIAGVVLGLVGLVAFWPRLSVTILPDSDLLVWQYSLKNDSFFRISISPTCHAFRLGFRGGMQMTDVGFIPGTARPVAIRSGEEHVFRCTSIFGEAAPQPLDGGKVGVDLACRYLGVSFSKRACFELSSARGGPPQWLAAACD